MDIFLVVGTISGIGSFAIRFSGGPQVELPSRASKFSVPTERLPKELHDLILSIDDRSEKLMSTRWGKVLAPQNPNPAEIRTLTRRDAQEAREGYHELREDVERVLKVFAEARSKGIDLSTAWDKPAGLTHLETWLTAQEMYTAAEQYLDLIDQHWDEWSLAPFSRGTDPKSWQWEESRLVEVAADASKRFHALLMDLAPATPTSSASVREQ